MWHRSLHTRASGSWDIYRGGRTSPRVWYPPLWRKIFFSSTLVLRTRWIYTSGLLHVNVAIQITCYTRYKRQRKIYRIVLFFTTKKHTRHRRVRREKYSKFCCLLQKIKPYTRYSFVWTKNLMEFECRCFLRWCYTENLKRVFIASEYVWCVVIQSLVICVLGAIFWRKL